MAAAPLALVDVEERLAGLGRDAAVGERRVVERHQRVARRRDGRLRERGRAQRRAKHKTQRSRKSHPGAATFEQLRNHLVPMVEMLRLDFGRDDVRREPAVLRNELGDRRRHVRPRRQVVRLLEDRLAFRRGQELDEELPGIRMRRIPRQRDQARIDGGRVEPHPIDRRALLGADRGVVIEDLQAHGVFAADHLVEDRPRAGVDHPDVLLGEPAQIVHAALLAHAQQDVADEAGGAGHVVRLPDHLVLPVGQQQVVVALRPLRRRHQAGVQARASSHRHGSRPSSGWDRGSAAAARRRSRW